MGRYQCIQPQYYFVLRTNTVRCRLHLLCSTCQHPGVDHRTVPAETLGRRPVMLRGLLLPWSILFVQRHNISRISIHKECFAVCLNFCSTRELQERAWVLVCQGVKFHCLSYLLCGQTWTAAFDYPMLFLIAKCCFKHMPANFNERPSSNCFKFMVSSHEILIWPLQRNIFAAIFCILNMPRRNYFWMII